METKTITVDIGFLSPESTSTYEYERFMEEFKKDMLKRAILAGDVTVAIHILENELIGEDTADAGKVYEEALITILHSGEVNMPMLEAVIASINSTDDALEYLSESEAGGLMEILVDALDSKFDNEVIQALASINASVYWGADIVDLVGVTNTEGINLILSRHPIEDDEEAIQKLQELEQEIIDERELGDEAETERALAQIQLIHSYIR